MQYLLLIYDEEQLWASMPEEERNGIYAQMYRRQLLEEELDVDTERDEHERRVRASQESAPTNFRTRMGGGGMGENA